MTASPQTLSEILESASHDEVLREWLREAGSRSHTQSSSPSAQSDASDLLNALNAAIRSGADATQFETPIWAPTREILESISQSRAAQGVSAGETSQFVMALKRPLFKHVQDRLAGADASRVVQAIWSVSTLVDKMAQWTSTTYQRSREDIIERQQEELLELSTPVVKLWDGVLAVPMIGTLDSSRTQIVMESLLQRIVETGSEARHHRHHRRADRRHAGRAAPAEDRRRDPPDGRRLHHQRHPAADRADHRPPGHRPAGHRHQGHAGRRAGAGAEEGRLHRHAHQGSDGAGMERIPILRMGEFLLVTIQVDMQDQTALALQDDLAAKIAETGANGVLIDISALEIVDSFIGRMLASISASRACSTRRRWWSACSRPSRSRWSSSACRCRACARRSTSSAAWPCFAMGAMVDTAIPPPSGAMPLREERDIVLSRQMVRKLTQELKFSLVDQTKMITAASELSRNTVVYGGGGEMRWEFVEQGAKNGLRLTFAGQGPRHPRPRPGADRRLDVRHRHGHGPVRQQAAGQRVRHPDDRWARARA